MDDDDETFLKSFNSTRDVASQCSEDQFEEVMDFFEQTAQVKQPYASVDSPPVLTYEDMESAFEETLNDFAKHFAKEIYGHWKTRRVMTSNKPLIAGLKVSHHCITERVASLTVVEFETGAETDDSDPYVCFRRRESRQVRKTRGRDAHSAEKLKKLRKELEESRQIMALIRQREITKREQLNIEKQLFEQRSRLKQGKRNLPDPHKEGDEDLLINQKVRKTLAYIRIQSQLLNEKLATKEKTIRAQHTSNFWYAVAVTTKIRYANSRSRSTFVKRSPSR